MNFIAATVVLKSTSPDPVTAYGLSYRSADAVVPGGNGNSEVRLRLLCYDRAGAKLDAWHLCYSAVRDICQFDQYFKR